MRSNDHFVRPEVVDYIIESYAGYNGKKREFIWTDSDRNIVIGNSRAFCDHLAEKFGWEAKVSNWSGLHSILRKLGERVRPYEKHGRTPGRRFRNQEPETRIIGRAEE